MVILIVERVPVGLRGELSRWMIEPRTNVFVGKVSAMVREKLWEMACAKSKGGSVLMIYPARTEQGYTIRSEGETSRQIKDFDGLLLVSIPKPTAHVEEDSAKPVQEQSP